MGWRAIRRAAGPISSLTWVLLACPRQTGNTAAPSDAASSVHAGLDYAFARTIEGDLGKLVGLDVERSRVFTLSEREVLRYWDLDSGELLAVHPGQGPFYEATRSADGSLVALNSYRHVSVWRVADGEEILRWDGKASRSSLSDDGQRLALMREGTYRVLDVSSGELVGEWQGQAGVWIELGAGDSRLFSLYGYPDRGGTLWSVPDGREIAAIADADQIRGDYVFGDYYGSNNCEAWRADDGQHWFTFEGYCRDIAAHGELLMTRQDDAHLAAWSVSERKRVAVFDIPRETVVEGERRRWDVSSDGRHIASWHTDETRVWAVATGKLIHRLLRANHADFHDGALIIDVHEGPTIELDLETGAQLELPPGYWVLRRTADSRVLWAKHGTRRWSIADGTLSPLVGGDLITLGPRLDPAGERIVAIDRYAVQVWSAATGERLERCDALDEVPNALRWLDDDRVLVVEERTEYELALSSCTTGEKVGRSKTSVGSALRGLASAEPERAWHDVARTDAYVAASTQFEVVLFDAKTGMQLSDFDAHYYHPRLEFDPSGSYLTLSYVDEGHLYAVEVLEVPSLRRVWSVGESHRAKPNSVYDHIGAGLAWEPSGRLLVVALQVPEREDRRPLAVDPNRWIDVPLEVPAQEGSLFFSPSFSADGRRLTVAEGYDRVHVFERRE